MFVAGSSTKLKLESYKAGYPRLAAFLNLDRNFGVWKRFDYLHVRNLLELQDELNELEAELRAIDAAETTRLYLSSRRQDGNFNRRHVLSLIRRKLEEYGW
ncbi:hypothetical protein QBC40DRAFT_85743 [Triangularia verruculosa]|uniref:DUF6594 domain-containing protein n=1 Tax=Triangularia verruculosa TaxID=2587418 RepID=A0AAN6XET6_9PEZI|nr:hypothetical protein QBC40DRAFT_85743 [Triangularia verruculosa]